MSDRTLQKDDADEQRMAELIRNAGARVQPDAATREAVRAAVHAEWRAVVATRRRDHQRRWGWSLAAAAVVAAAALWLVVPQLMPAGAMLAEVTRVSGPVRIRAAGLLRSTTDAEAGASLGVGAELRTAAGGRAALRMGAASVRLDEGSVVVLAAADRLVLREGAVYVDTGEDGADPLRVETPLGTVEHLGTQYETRIAADTLRVSVREGRVRLRGEGQEIDSVAGQRVTLQQGGVVRRQAIERNAADWAWAGEIAPAFDIENRSLAEFLRWVSRETGLQLAYASAQVEQTAGTVVLRGSIEGLTPAQALAAVLATTTLQSRQGANNTLLIDSKKDGR